MQGAKVKVPRQPTILRAIAKFAVVVCALCAVSLTLVFEFAGADLWWSELARYVPYPAYLVPALLALALSLGLAWAWRVAAGVTLALVLVPIMGLELNTGEKGSSRVRVMTYNVKAYRALEREGGFAAIAWELALHDADVIVMQDAGYLAHLLESSPKSAERMFGKRKVAISGQYIIASRLPLRECKDGDISFPGENHHYFRCAVSAKGVEFDVFAVHLLTPRQGLNATRHERLDGIDDWQHNVASRMFQARSLASQVAANARPVVIAGDLNAPGHSPVIAQLVGAGLRDAFSTAGVGYGYTHGHSLRPHISFARLDHVLVSTKFGVADSFVGGKEASEHRPVIADLWLERGK